VLELRNDNKKEKIPIEQKMEEHIDQKQKPIEKPSN
jgi:hypothetical protein